MRSTNSLNSNTGSSSWQEAGLRYFTRSHYLRKRFVRRVWRISIDGGNYCPHRDAVSGAGGCIFCNPASFSPSVCAKRKPIREQVASAVERLRARRRAERFLAYFQPGTNTLGPTERLEGQYREALSHPEVVGLIVGTRPDCVAEDVLTLLEQLARETWVSVELGLQSIHERSLRWMNRGHGYAAFLDAVERARGRGFEIGAHVILGLPGESPQDMIATADELARLGIDSVKLHNLHAVRGTPLADMVQRGEVNLPEVHEYVARAVDFLERLPPTCVIDRLSGDAPREYLVAPQWCLDKGDVRRRIEAEFARRGTSQGAKYEEGR
jgi:radical SAM protein (TIGR01212 family)